MAGNAPPVPVVFDELVWKQEHDGPWGFVFAVTIDDNKRPVLHFRAFGMRHPPKASNKPSVYERADRRLRKDQARQ
jgi:hypothetical protein